MQQTFEIPLDIPDVTIESVRTNPAGHLEITVKSTVAGTPCHQCGQQTTQVYGEDREITLLDRSLSSPAEQTCGQAPTPALDARGENESLRIGKK